MTLGCGLYQYMDAGDNPQRAVACGVNLYLAMLCPRAVAVINQARPKSRVILRPDEGDDNAQVDTSRTPESEADHWVGIIRDRSVAGRYAATCGICERWPAGNPDGLRWRAAFEARLCHRVQTELGLGYAWGAIPVGNLEPSELPLFAKVLDEAWATNYHGYLKPGCRSVADETEPWWLWRPTRLWLPECRRLGLRFPPLFLGETGTYNNPREMGLTAWGQSELCIEIDAQVEAECKTLGVEYIGSCGFGFGTVGTMAVWDQLGSEPMYARAVPPDEGDGDVTGELERWAADVFKRAGVPFNPNAALVRYWLECARRGEYLGKPEGPEHPSEEGIPMQEFAGAVLYYRDGLVVRGLPF